MEQFINEDIVTNICEFLDESDRNVMLSSKLWYITFLKHAKISTISIDRNLFLGISPEYSKNVILLNKNVDKEFLSKQCIVYGIKSDVECEGYKTIVSTNCLHITEDFSKEERFKYMLAYKIKDDFDYIKDIDASFIESCFHMYKFPSTVVALCLKYGKLDVHNIDDEDYMKEVFEYKYQCSINDNLWCSDYNSLVKRIILNHKHISQINTIICEYITLRGFYPDIIIEGLCIGYTGHLRSLATKCTDKNCITELLTHGGYGSKDNCRCKMDIECSCGKRVLCTYYSISNMLNLCIKRNLQVVTDMILKMNLTKNDMPSDIKVSEINLNNSIERQIYLYALEHDLIDDYSQILKVCAYYPDIELLKIFLNAGKPIPNALKAYLKAINLKHFEIASILLPHVEVRYISNDNGLSEATIVYPDNFVWKKFAGWNMEQYKLYMKLPGISKITDFMEMSYYISYRTESTELHDMYIAFLIRNGIDHKRYIGDISISRYEFTKIHWDVSFIKQSEDGLCPVSRSSILKRKLSIKDDESRKRFRWDTLILEIEEICKTVETIDEVLKLHYMYKVLDIINCIYALYYNKAIDKKELVLHIEDLNIENKERTLSILRSHPT